MSSNSAPVVFDSSTDDDEVIGTGRRRSISSPRVEARQKGQEYTKRFEYTNPVCTSTVFFITFFQTDGGTWSFSIHQVFTNA